MLRKGEGEGGGAESECFWPADEGLLGRENARFLSQRHIYGMIHPFFVVLIFSISVVMVDA